MCLNLFLSLSKAVSKVFVDCFEMLNARLDLSLNLTYEKAELLPITDFFGDGEDSYPLLPTVVFSSS